MPKQNYRHLRDQDPWMLAEHIPDIDFFFCEIFLSAFVNELSNACGKNYVKDCATFERFELSFYFGERDSQKFEDYLVRKIIATPAFGEAINRNIRHWSDQLNGFADKLAKLNLKKLTNADLVKLLTEHDDIHTKLYEWGWLSNATDMFHGTFTTTLKNNLRKMVAGTGHALNLTFDILSTPEQRSQAAIEEDELLRLAVALKKNNFRWNKQLEEKIKLHRQRYGHARSLWIGKYPPYSISYYKRQTEALARDIISPEKRLRLEGAELRKSTKEKTRLYRELKISKAHARVFRIYSDFMLTKLYRRYAQLWAAYHMRRLLKEIGKRIGLSLDEVRFVLPEEFTIALRSGKINKQEIKKRSRFCLLYEERGKFFVSTDKRHPLLKKLRREKTKQVKEFSGQIACLGKAKGKVKIVNSPEDMAKMKQGDILVSIATNPDIVPAMKKAAAIITEQGGITSHAAIVSRELSIPCVIGTKIATAALKDGDLVEVDAQTGTIKILN